MDGDVSESRDVDVRLRCFITRWRSLERYGASGSNTNLPGRTVRDSDTPNACESVSHAIASGLLCLFTSVREDSRGKTNNPLSKL